MVKVCQYVENYFIDSLKPKTTKISLLSWLNVTRTLDMRSCLSLSVVDSVTGANLTTVEAAIANQLRDEETRLKCGACSMEGSRQSNSLSVLPKVKSLET